MRSISNSSLYWEEIRAAANLPIRWEAFQKKTVLIAGATGMVGSYLVDVLMQKNEVGLDCGVIAIGRSREKAKHRCKQAETSETYIGRAGLDNSGGFIGTSRKSLTTD